MPSKRPGYSLRGISGIRRESTGIQEQIQRLIQIFAIRRATELDSATFDQPERASVRFSKSIVPEPGASALRLMSLQNT
jgi:exonuclease I